MKWILVSLHCKILNKKLKAGYKAKENHRTEIKPMIQILKKKKKMAENKKHKINKRKNNQNLKKSVREKNNGNKKFIRIKTKKKENDKLENGKIKQTNRKKKK